MSDKTGKLTAGLMSEAEFRKHFVEAVANERLGTVVCDAYAAALAKATETENWIRRYNELERVLNNLGYSNGGNPL